MTDIIAEGLRLGRAIAEAADVPDDIRRARAIGDLTRRLSLSRSILAHSRRPRVLRIHGARVAEAEAALRAMGIAAP